MLPAQATNPIIRWEYLVDEWDQISEALVQHLRLTVVSLLIGIVVSAVLSAVALRYRWTMGPISGAAAVIYTIPSVALFGILVPFTGLSMWTAVIPLVGYTLLVLVTNFVAGFRSVPDAVRDAADDMGMSPFRRVVGVELPIAVPYLVAGVRIATVSTVGLVTIAAIIGQGGLGRLILDGLRRSFWTPMVVGASLSILLAVALDLLIHALGRLATPWERAARRRERGRAPT